MAFHSCFYPHGAEMQNKFEQNLHPTLCQPQRKIVPSVCDSEVIDFKQSLALRNRGTCDLLYFQVQNYFGEQMILFYWGPRNGIQTY